MAPDSEGRVAPPARSPLGLGPVRPPGTGQGARRPFGRARRHLGHAGGPLRPGPEGPFGRGAPPGVGAWFGGRIKTLHPGLLGGILAPRTEEGTAELERRSLVPNRPGRRQLLPVRGGTSRETEPTQSRGARGRGGGHPRPRGGKEPQVGRGADGPVRLRSGLGRARPDPRFPVRCHAPSPRPTRVRADGPVRLRHLRRTGALVDRGADAVPRDCDVPEGSASPPVRREPAPGDGRVRAGAARGNALAVAPRASGRATRSPTRISSTSTQPSPP